MKPNPVQRKSPWTNSPSDFKHLFFAQKGLFDSLLSMVKAKRSASRINNTFAKRFEGSHSGIVNDANVVGCDAVSMHKWLLASE